MKLDFNCFITTDTIQSSQGVCYISAVSSGSDLGCCCSHKPKNTFLYTMDYSLLRDRIHMVDFPPSFTRETTFVTSYLLSCSQNPFLKKDPLKRKDMLPFEEFLSPFFRAEPIS